MRYRRLLVLASWVTCLLGGAEGLTHPAESAAAVGDGHPPQNGAAIAGAAVLGGDLPPPPVAGSAREAVARALGEGTVVVTSEESGLVAINTRTGARFALAPGLEGEVLADPRSNVLWIDAPDETNRANQVLILLDLEKPLGRKNPMPIFRGKFYKAAVISSEPSETLSFTLRGIHDDLKVNLADGKISGVSGKATPDAAAILVEIGARHRAPAVLPFPKKKLPRLKVPCEPCHGCGRASELPGSSGWWVVTANASGDVEHVVLELYDPKTKEFISGQSFERSKKPFGDVRDSINESWICRPGDTFIDFSGYEVTSIRGKAFERKSRVACLDGAWKLWDADKPGLCPEMSAE
jgi:hypothetical protein